MNWKKYCRVLAPLMILTFLLAAFSMPVDAAGKKRIAVVDFENKSQVRNAGMGRGMADILVTELVRNKTFEVVEREQMRNVLNEQGLGLTGVVDPSTAPQLGKVLGLNYLVFGSIVSAGVEKENIGLGNLFGGMVSNVNTLRVKVVVNIRMVDATTGSIVFSEDYEGKVEKTGISGDVGSYSGDFSSSIFSDAARQALAKVVAKINEYNPLEGFVVQISGRRVMIDLGREQGVQPGQEYIVYREGNIIKHPVTGKILGVEKNDLATLRISSVDVETSMGELLGSGGSLLQPGDKVRKK